MSLFRYNHCKWKVGQIFECSMLISCQMWIGGGREQMMLFLLFESLWSGMTSNCVCISCNIWQDFYTNEVVKYDTCVCKNIWWLGVWLSGATTAGGVQAGDKKWLIYVASISCSRWSEGLPASLCWYCNTPFLDNLNVALEFTQDNCLAWKGGREMGKNLE